jgi:hypothetical protein
MNGWVFNILFIVFKTLRQVRIKKDRVDEVTIVRVT